AETSNASCACTARAAAPMSAPRVLARGDAPLIESFLDMMSAERGASANTLAAYRRDLVDFSASRAGAGGDLKAATREQVRSYLSLLARASVAPSTQARKLSALRQFYGYLYSEKIRRDDPTGAVDAPKPGRPLPKVLSQDELGK